MKAKQQTAALGGGTEATEPHEKERERNDNKATKAKERTRTRGSTPKVAIH